MNKFFAPNIGKAGRVARAAWGLGLIIVGFVLFDSIRWVSILLFLFGAFALYEALRSWCIMRACGIRTRL
jgi:hypothetical protein